MRCHLTAPTVESVRPTAPVESQAADPGEEPTGKKGRNQRRNAARKAAAAEAAGSADASGGTSEKPD
eukprot:6696508-Alexandrium_andersonii.AAC.1